MPKRLKASARADDAPLTDKELRSARRLRDAEPTLVAAIKRSRGRPAGRSKETIHISLDADIVATLRKNGKGWQTRLNEMLRVAMGLLA
jgi:uncharacterized protein (DUF4415 family)